MEDGRIAEPPEEEYDALNDETFGSAINGDWEEAHESMVRLTGDVEEDGATGDSLVNSYRQFRNYGKSKYSSDTPSPAPSSSSAATRLRNMNADSDLELNLSGMRLDDVDLNYGDSDVMNDLSTSGIHLDPSVWASHPLRPLSSSHQSNSNSVLVGHGSNRERSNGLNPAEFLRENFSSPFQQLPDRLSQQHMPQSSHGLKSDLPAIGDISRNSFGLPPLPQQGGQGAPKISTLEDIERNIMIQQAMQKQQQKLNEILKLSSKSNAPSPLPQESAAAKQQPPGIGQPQHKGNYIHILMVNFSKNRYRRNILILC